MQANSHSSKPSAIEIIALTKRYGSGKPAVDSINLRIASGSYCCLRTAISPTCPQPSAARR
jgi:putative spermidine/putrescine transport system ATP-binding protein